MAEVAVVQTGTGQAARLEELAKRINEKHQAYVTGIKTALGQLKDAVEHALDAGDLLIEAKAEHKAKQGHGTWELWVEANCELSVRRAQEYMYLAERREYIDMVKARGTAFSSIGNALEFLRLIEREAKGTRPVDQPTAPGPSVPGVFTSELPIETKARRAKERAQQKLQRKAEFALRTGDIDRPDDLTAWEQRNWRAALHKAMDTRTENLPNLVDILGHQLHNLSMQADPEAWGRYLVEKRIGYEEQERRADILAELQIGLTWLQQVLEQAEQAQQRE